MIVLPGKQKVLAMVTLIYKSSTGKIVPYGRVVGFSKDMLDGDWDDHDDDLSEWDCPDVRDTGLVLLDAIFHHEYDEPKLINPVWLWKPETVEAADA